MTQQELGDRAEVTRSRMGEYERGVYACTVDILDRLASALDVPVAELFDETNFEEPAQRKRRKT